jgi:hypothetical protein
MRAVGKSCIPVPAATCTTRCAPCTTCPESAGLAAGHHDHDRPCQCQDRRGQPVYQRQRLHLNRGDAGNPPPPPGLPPTAAERTPRQPAAARRSATRTPPRGAGRAVPARSKGCRGGAARGRIRPDCRRYSAGGDRLWLVVSARVGSNRAGYLPSRFADRVLHPTSCVFDVHGKVAGGLGDPGGARVGAGAEDTNWAGGVLDKERDVESRVGQRRGFEESPRAVMAWDCSAGTPPGCRRSVGVPGRCRPDAGSLTGSRRRP